RLAPRLCLAAGIALLIAAPVLLPFAHFFHEFDKAVEPTFSWSQPLAYVPLNLVISDHSFYLIKALGHEPYSSPYVLFVGWVPVLLALWGLGDRRGGEWRREKLFLAALVILTFWLASAGPFKLLFKVLPLPPLIRFLSGVRNTAFMAGLAVPPILGLSAIGLDRLFKARWPGLPSALPAGLARILSLRWLLLIPLVLALRSAWDFGKPSIRLAPPFPPYIAGVLSSLKTPDSQWVSTPRGEHYWIEPALARGLKLANNAYLTWRWRARPSPEPALAASYAETFPGMAQASVVSGIRIFAAPPGREYAAVLHADGRRTVCSARGTGGNIDVLCDTPSAGALIVRENSWSGWKARLAGREWRLLPGRWLSVELPRGHNTIQFRYRPWDLPLGLVLCLGGLGLASREVIRDRRDGGPANGASERLAAGS
ncbi:MAG TPA: hypothetical protein VER78_04050, partial [Thermoanaerobaculia bacterium]|nr:hypothetical protein [Thermoanaerobaculia bacterium]